MPLVGARVIGALSVLRGIKVWIVQRTGSCAFDSRTALRCLSSRTASGKHLQHLDFSVVESAEAIRDRVSSAIARMHLRLTQKSLTAISSAGVPLIIEVLSMSFQPCRKLHNFINLFDAEGAYQCRIHGGDRFATTPDAWQGRTHARHVVVTTPRKFADTINTGIAAREDCYVRPTCKHPRGPSAGASSCSDCERWGCVCIGSMVA